MYQVVIHIPIFILTTAELDEELQTVKKLLEH